LAGVLLVVAVAGAWFSLQSGFADTTTNLFRLILLVALGAVAFFMLVKPLRQLRRETSAFVEGRVPEFNGRIETYAQMKASANAFLELLAEDSLKVSERHPVEEEIRSKELGLFAAVLAAALAVFLYLLLAGPGLFDFSLRNLLAGWANPDMRPP